MPHLRSQRAQREGVMDVALRALRPEAVRATCSVSLSSRDGLGDLYIFGDIKGGPTTYKHLRLYYHCTTFSTIYRLFWT